MVVRQLLLPLFQDWTHATMASLPSVSQVGTISPLRPLPVFHRRRFRRPSRPLPSQPHMFPMRSPLVLLLHLTDVNGVRSSCSLFDVSHSNRMVIAAGRPATVPPAHVPAPPSSPSPVGAPPTTSAGRPSSLPPPPHPVRSCSRRGCTSLVLPLCTTGCCDTHCHSHRCHFHHPSSPASHPPTTPSVRSGNPHRRRPPPPHNRCSVGFCSAHCTSRRCRRRTPPSPLQPHCRHSGCAEPAPPGCPVRFSIAPALVVWSTTLFPCRETVRGRLADGRRHREPLLCRSLLWFGAVQLSSSLGARWGCARRVHGPRQLFGPARSPSSLCPRNTVSLMGTLPTDQPFRYDGPVGSYPIPGIADLQSLRWRVVSGVICVCSFYAPHVGTSLSMPVWSSGARWQVLCIVSHTPIQGYRC